MSAAVELELTFLANALPDLSGMRRTTMEDVYFPGDTGVHPQLRVRRRGDVHKITKKVRVAAADASQHIEATIPLTADEYDALVDGRTRRILKTRYQCTLAGHPAEVDVFSGELKGLVLIDFEFDDVAELDTFVAPPICLADVTNEEFLAGGLLAGKHYADIANDLKRFGYRAITIGDASTP